MTTNHIQNLDPVLLRYWIVNLTEKIDYPNKELIQEFYKLYFQNANKTV